LRPILKFIDKLSIAAGKTVSILTLLVAVAIMYEIIKRYFFNEPTIWAAETTVFACCLVYLLGAAWTMVLDGHVRIDLLYASLTPRKRAILDSCTFIFFLGYILAMLWATWTYALESVDVMETTMSPWDPPIWPMKLAMVVGFSLVLLQGIAKFIRDLYMSIKGEPL
jgi:TRAP-type mannitol/chloroaromatic compound transport system permease small subunit